LRSSSGEHYIALDHVRALAAFMVFTWHFVQAWRGDAIRFEYAPDIFVFALLDEGHTGVALFMTLSGYLFAKLLDGKTIAYRWFLWNRVLRLLPLLALVLLVLGVQKYLAGGNMSDYADKIVAGLVYPTLPHGGWSITAEFHYYLILPLFLWLFRRAKALPVVIVLAAMALRTALYREEGEVQWLAYWTIVGRIDQFTLGMLAFHFRAVFTRRHVLATGVLCAFALFYWYFDLQGGFHGRDGYLSRSPLWIFMPTLEGLAYAAGIAWYDSSFRHSTTGASAFLGRAGQYSYSIYLLHFFVVFHVSGWAFEHVLPQGSFYAACAWSALFFCLMVPVGALSFRFIESPFLKLRRPYVVKTGR
jgi:peptidoglycan/LPS O-acetylase OafA/YrhL